MPANRYLKGYTLDPSFSNVLKTYNVNETVYKIPWENVDPGPKGEYLEVLDFDAPNECWYQPIDLDNAEVISQQGLKPSEGNPQFHQQFVYTIGMKIIRLFEDALGRKIIWRPNHYNDVDEEDGIEPLRIYPHALLEANAYYNSEKNAILFGYFKAEELFQGINIPGSTVFTCLSPDIIAHEMTHAILDSIHPHFIENTNPDVAAFHEAFADIIALLEMVGNKDLVTHQLLSANGQIDSESIFGNLATQVGQASKLGHHALRNMIGYYDKKGKWRRIKADRFAQQKTQGYHDKGGVFVACVFDAFIRLYNHSTQDLLRIAKYDENSKEAISIDLVNRLTKEAIEISQTLLKICIQALDFVPPCDITFGDYIRAMITADMEMTPEDNGGYRVALIESFRDWGFMVDRVNTMSAESLKWSSPKELFENDFDVEALAVIVSNLKPIIRELLGKKNRSQIYNLSRKINTIIHGLIIDELEPTKVYDKEEEMSIINFKSYQSNYESQINQSTSQITYDKKKKVSMSLNDVKKNNGWRNFLENLGLMPNMGLMHEYEGKKIPFNQDFKLQVLNLRPVYRSSRDGRRIDQVVVSLLQTLRVEKKGHDLNGLKFRGGCTLVFDLSETSTLTYAIVKKLISEQRLKNQLKHQLGYDNFYELNSSFMDEDKSFLPLQIKNLHSHE
ncbi:hypothetical protein [uncultured Psychroserpens sp.]|uniref:hypothetical protein n=1 Tax=uncultured Psychroserpens sp. TaxID=255436 RepID=UPI0026041D6E|nr:hypothetical protein [uncultured Psychroserpens sp.]